MINAQPQKLSDALTSVYGGDDRSIADQAQRYMRALRGFERRFGKGPVSIFRAPGRVNLIGEHTDYNQGYVMPIALDKDVLLLARPRADNRINLVNAEARFPDRTFLISGEIPHQPVGDWANYAQGPAQLLERTFGPGLHGFDGLVCGELPWGIPRGAGLSSSSALTVASAVAMVHLNDLPISGTSLADLCGRAEWYVGTRGGIMDQFISLLGQRNHALFLDCRPDSHGEYCYRHVPLPEDYAIVVIDSRVRHRNTGPDFNQRVVEGRIGVALLKTQFGGMTHLRDVEALGWDRVEDLLPQRISETELANLGISPSELLDSPIPLDRDCFEVRRRCRHVVTENERVLLAVDALSRGALDELMLLMAEAHHSARHDYGISTPELDLLVQLAEEQPGASGARLTGAGWGGCVVALVLQQQVAEFERIVAQRYQAETGRKANLFVCKPASGAGFVYST